MTNNLVFLPPTVRYCQSADSGIVAVHGEDNGGHRAAAGDRGGGGGGAGAARARAARRHALDRDILPADHRRLAAAAADRLPADVGHAQLLWTG